jgi:hypothetical protein
VLAVIGEPPSLIRGNPFRQGTDFRGDVVENPLHPVAASILYRIRVNHEGKALRARWWVAPRQGRRDVIPFARILFRDHRSIAEGSALETEW